MENQNCFTPPEMVQIARENAQKKISVPKLKIISLAIFAGFYIGTGGMLMILAYVGAQDFLPFGLIRIIMGLVFSVGLIFVVLGGAELFTGSTILSLAYLDKKISLIGLLNNWILVYMGNFIGSLLLVILMVVSGRHTFGNNAIFNAIAVIAENKLHYSFIHAFVLGILCNIFVCLAIYLAISSKSIGGKIICIVLPITVFVAMGFEHSVANMFILSWYKVVVGNIAWFEILFNNLLPVTLGNILGGLFIWVPYYYIYKNN